MNLIMQDTCPQSEDTRLIPLTQGQFAVVDASDYDWLMQWKWYAGWDKATGGFYAARQIRSKPKRQTHLAMHRFILGLKRGDGLYGDHINHNTLDNRRANLRIATNAENGRNSRKRSDNTSGDKGIVWRKDTQKWRALIRVDGKLINIGHFLTREEARAARLKAAQELHGEFACF